MYDAYDPSIVLVDLDFRNPAYGSRWQTSFN
jgi:hypothetical protein